MKRQQIVSKTIDLLHDKNPSITSKENQTIFELKNPNNNQIVIIQIFSDSEIWIRLSEPNSGYYCESYEELEEYFKKLISNEIEVAIGYKDSIWEESVIVNSNQYKELNTDFEYVIASWKNT